MARARRALPAAVAARSRSRSLSRSDAGGRQVGVRVGTRPAVDASGRRVSDGQRGRLRAGAATRVLTLRIVRMQYFEQQERAGEASAAKRLQRLLPVRRVRYETRL